MGNICGLWRKLTFLINHICSYARIPINRAIIFVKERNGSMPTPEETIRLVETHTEGYIEREKHALTHLQIFNPKAAQAISPRNQPLLQATSPKGNCYSVVNVELTCL